MENATVSRYPNLVPIKPGETRNPQGSSKVQREFQHEIRKRSDNGKELIEYLFANLRDPKINELIRFKSVELLIHYGFGKPREADSEEQKKVFDFSKLTPVELEVLRGIHSKVFGEQVVTVQPLTTPNP